MEFFEVHEIRFVATGSSETPSKRSTECNVGVLITLSACWSQMRGLRDDTAISRSHHYKAMMMSPTDAPQHASHPCDSSAKVAAIYASVSDIICCVQNNNCAMTDQIWRCVLCQA
eukprot:3774669-Pleurochrysis_carterae.AAC.2